jgi:hypothetical protein
MDKMFPLQTDVLELTDEEHAALKIIEIIDGYVYHSTYETTFSDPDLPCWFMTLCLETLPGEALPKQVSLSDPSLHIMPWPLLGNEVSPRLGCA